MNVNALTTRVQEWVRDAECPRRIPPAPTICGFCLPGPYPCRARLPAETARLRCEHQAVSRSPYIAEWSRRVDPLAPIHSLPFTTFRLYKDWLIPIFFFFCCLCNEKLSTRSLIKFYAHPTPSSPKSLPKKRKKGDLNLELI